MATVIPGSSYIQKGVFGGPAGSTDNAIQQFINGILQGAERRRQNHQNQMISEGFSNPDTSYSQIGQNIMANPQIDQANKARAMQELGTMAQIESLQESIPSKAKSTIWVGKSGDNTSWVPVEYKFGESNKVINDLKIQGYNIFRKDPPKDATLTGDAGNLEVILNRKPTLEELKAYKSLASSATPTDIDDYVNRANEESIRNTGNPLTPGEQNKAALEFKRAQEKEVAANRLAERTVDQQTAQKIKYNEGIGKALAEIETAGSLIEAKGEVTPQAKKNIAKTRMTGNLAKLANHYINLDSTGAMLNVDKSTSDNILAAMRSSDIGQMFGRITGSNEQSIRSSIKKIKPLLIQDIRESTDMGARGLDSEKELEFYLQAATDEKTDIQSNIAAIVVLDEAFGRGEIANQLRNLTNESLIKRISDEGSFILSGELKGIPTPKKYNISNQNDEDLINKYLNK